MNWLKRIFGGFVAWMSQYVKSGQAQKDVVWALAHVKDALPVVGVLMDVGTVVTPTGIDDALWKIVKNKYPAFWDGTLKTDEEFKGYLLLIGAELFRQKFPQIDTTVARLTVQAAYSEYRGLQAEKAV